MNREICGWKIFVDSREVVRKTADGTVGVRA